MPWYVPALLTAAGWGLAYTLAESVTKGITKPTYLLLCGIIQCCFFACMAAKQEKFGSDLRYLWETPRALPFLLMISFVSIASNYLSLTAIQLKNAASAAAVETTYPLWTALFAYLLFGQSQLSIAGLFGTVMVMGGICIIALTGKH